MKNLIKRKEICFQKVGKKSKTIVITTNGNNRNFRIAEQENNEVHIIPETQLSQDDEGEDAQVSTEKNNFFFHGQGALHVRESKLILSPKILNLSGYSLSKNQKNILIKGIKYTPTPKRNIIELKRDVVEYSRKLRLI